MLILIYSILLVTVVWNFRLKSVVYRGIKRGVVYFLEGDTQVNAVVIDRLLDHNDGVIATDTIHINVYEGDTIESNRDLYR